MKDTSEMDPPANTNQVLGCALRREGRIRRFRPGQALFTEGDRAERVFLIERGWVVVSCLAAGGREIVLGVRGRGEILGDMSVLDGEPRSASAVAIDEVEAIVAPGSTLARALEDVHAANELIRVLAARLRDSDRKRLEFAALETLGRVAWRLLEMSDMFGHSTAQGIALELPISQEQLASWCGASREATVKALAALRSTGCVSTGRHTVLIHDVESLRRHAEGYGEAR